MNEPFLNGISTMRLGRDGTMSVAFTDGRVIEATLGNNPFAPTSAIRDTTFHTMSSQLHIRTTQDHDIHFELPAAGDLAPLHGRPTIYLDQNHWSTLTLAIHQPERVTNAEELAAASHFITLANAREIVLPMSAAHMSETCKQADVRERYNRGLTIAQLTHGWQLRDPLHIRLLELRHALASRYGKPSPLNPSAITLEPNVIHSGRDTDLPPIGANLPAEARWITHALRCAAGIIDTMLDAEAVPITSNHAWTAQFQLFADFLGENPTGRELKRRRTHAKFIADLGTELPKAAHSAGITPQETSDWTRNYSERDVHDMPALGLYRELLHEKLADPQLRWHDNDLVDMMYLTCAAGYCEHVVAERAHASHIRNGLRRLGRSTQVHTNLRSLARVI
ncbi:hypothetical protein H7I41_03960 [Mycobacterium manitobense]|uniref:Uncharacterized protein n=1 Tax=[Mycobacterium] manitobense TaxID=190147 RepID=A0A9X2YJF8_9MYCO|nr:hypothetical protein [[Mycobacterium] manitobense]MCV7169078.1 hypothetical protein [[Mycobacterium] manitobense]